MNKVMGFKVTGIPKAKRDLKKIGRKKLNKANNAIHEAGFAVELEVKESIAGRRAEKPSVDTGNFMKRVETDNSTFLQSRVGTNVRYAKHLEFGTHKIAARRHFRNTLEREKPKIEKHINRAMK